MRIHCIAPENGLKKNPCLVRMLLWNIVKAFQGDNSELAFRLTSVAAGSRCDPLAWNILTGVSAI